MKNFKYPLAIEGTKDQLLDLATKLEELGYKNDSEMGSYWHDGVNFLLTHWLRNGQMGFNQTDSNHTIVSASNHDLVLALAAMVDDDKFYHGELCYWSGQNPMFVTLDKLDKFENSCWASNVPSHSSLHDSHLRKATKEEIINHFTPKTFPFGIGLSFTQQNHHTTIEKEIVGYMLDTDSPRIKRAADIIANSGEMNENFYIPLPSNYAVPRLQEAGVLDLWFKPVYGQEKYEVGDTVITDGYHDEYDGKPLEILEINSNGYCIFNKKTGCNFPIGRIVRRATREEIEASQTKVITLRCEGGTFDIEVSRKGVYYKPENKWLDVNSLNQSINPIITSINVSGYDFKLVITTIDSGCKKQVPIEDWRKVLKAYNELRQAE